MLSKVYVTLPEWSIFSPLDLKDTTMYYYEDNDKNIYAYAVIDTDADELGNHLYFLEIKKEYQKLRIGTHIVNFLRSKYKHIWLDPQNRSHKFYLKLGAKPFVSHSGGDLLIFSDRKPSENWLLFTPDGKFCEKPDDDFVYVEEDWDYIYKYF